MNAYVIYPDGQRHDLVKDNKNICILEYVYAWVEPGQYTINVYHYPNTKITEADHQLNEKNKDEEIITIEE